MRYGGVTNDGYTIIFIGNTQLLHTSGCLPSEDYWKNLSIHSILGREDAGRGRRGEGGEWKYLEGKIVKDTEYSWLSCIDGMKGVKRSRRNRAQKDEGKAEVSWYG